MFDLLCLTDRTLCREPFLDRVAAIAAARPAALILREKDLPEDQYQALAAQATGADYLGVGACFPSPTKPNAKGITREALADICAAVSLPVVAIGGITLQNARQLQGVGMAGLAVISALFAAPDITTAARDLLALSRHLTEGGAP